MKLLKKCLFSKLLLEIEVQAPDWEKMFAKHIYNRGLIAAIKKKNLITEHNMNTLIWKGQKTGYDTSAQTINKWLIKHMKLIFKCISNKRIYLNS